MLPSGPNGQHLLFRHDREKLAVNTITPHRDGDPIVPNTELLKIEKNPDGGLSCETIWSPDDAPSTGPTKVTSPAYRSGWDAIWGTPDRKLN